MDLLTLLSQYSQGESYPMHMPGHKRNLDFLKLPDPVAIDITEIHGFDNLHAAEGVLKNAMDRAAALWGARKSHFLVNGSSSGILAALSATLPAGGTVAMDRASHKSAYHALELRDLTPRYLRRPIDPETGVFGALSPAEVERVLTASPDVGAVLVTSPTYEGVVSDIRAIADVVHAHGALLIVDEAHGAHLGFTPFFPKSAVTEGADVVVQSLHKTLPALTQSAILHIGSERVSEEKIAKFLSYYQTSSPSYLLMAGMDACVSLLREHGDELFAAYEARLRRFRQRTAELVHIRLLGGDSPAMWRFDPGKLYFSLRTTHLTGEAFGQMLREEFHIEPEMTTADGCLCMTSIADPDEGFDRLADAVNAIDDRLAETLATPRPAVTFLPDLPEMVSTPAEAAECPTETVSLTDAAGRIAGESIWAYPPDIPLLVPGERIDAGMIEIFAALQKSGVRLHSYSEGLPDRIRVLAPRTR
ncbi:MAG: aminotransferase class I/II-fold pyridoxal phosphate-dependent enzyme [Clostridia bacterium]|nr:aminotransferase class I/II-fold pyridoxal phosphate-dependent enzyme [Clostridia bacterium]